MALAAAPVVDRLAIVATPIVWLLSRTTNLVVHALGGDPNVSRGVMTDEELRDLVAGHQALSADERHIVTEVFDAGKRQIREVLVPRTEVEFLPASLPLADAAEIVADASHSRFPVYQESYDDVIGFVHARDLLDGRTQTPGMRVGEICRPVKQLPISKTVLSALSEMRRDRAHLAIVVDEYGGTAGIVTLEDLVEELIGDIQDEYDSDEARPRPAAGRPGRGRRPAQPGRVRRADRAGAARGAVRDGGGLPARRARPPARRGRVGRGGRPPPDRHPAGRPPDRPGPGRPGQRPRRPPTASRGRRLDRTWPRRAPDLAKRRRSRAGRRGRPPRWPLTRPGSLVPAPTRLRSMPSRAPGGDMASESGPVLVVDFGAQYAQLIARRVRECQVYSQIVPSTMTTAEMLALRPAAIILSGGPSSVYAPGAPPAPDGLLTAGVPLLGICYGFQLMMARPRRLGAAGPAAGEYGAATLELAAAPAEPGAKFGPTPAGPAGRAARQPAGLDVARGHVRGPAAGVHGDRPDRGHARGRGRGRRPRPVRDAVPSRGPAHRARA